MSSRPLPALLMVNHLSKLRASLFLFLYFNYFGGFLITCCTRAGKGEISLHTKVGVAPVWLWPSGFHCAICAQRGVIYTLMQHFWAGSSSAQQCASHTHDGPDTHIDRSQDMIHFIFILINYLNISIDTYCSIIASF